MKRLSLVRGTVCLLAVWGLVLCGTVSARGMDVKEATGLAEAFDTAIAAVVEEAVPTVVRIESEGKISMKQQHPGLEGENPFEGTPFEEFFKDQGFGFGNPRRGGVPPADMKTFSMGSGIILDAKKGLVLTNNHVVKDAKEITVVALVNGKEQDFKGEIVGQDPLKEIAIVRITNLNDAKLSEAKLGDSEAMKVGQSVLAIGNPFSYSHSVSKGIVSGKGRTSPELSQQVPYQDFIQTDAAINPGNSGGPLLNIRGEVIGINTFIAVAQGSAGFNGLGFAIPIDLIKAKLEELIEKGKVSYSYLGVKISKINEEVRKHSDIPGEGGALVEQVVKDGPAEKAGLEEQDIILEFEGKPVAGSQELVQMVGRIPIGEKVTVKIYRPKEKKNLTISMVTTERPVDADVASSGSSESKGKMGLSIQNLTDDLAKKFGYENEKGVLVSSVEQDSPAADQLRPGDLIIEVEWQAVKNTEEFWSAVSVAEKDHKEKGVLLRVKRRENAFLVVIQFEPKKKNE